MQLALSRHKQLGMLQIPTVEEEIGEPWLRKLCVSSGKIMSATIQAGSGFGDLIGVRNATTLLRSLSLSVDSVVCRHATGVSCTDFDIS